LRKAGTAGTVWVFEQAQDASGNDRLWMANGVDTPQKWDGVAGSTSNWVIAPGGVNPYFLRLWKNRMVIAGVNSQRLWFSAISDPETFAVTDWADIKSTSDDLDPLTWVELLGDALIVFKRRSTWEVYDAGTFANRQLGSPGCEDRFQSCECEGRCYFFTRNGVYVVAGASAPQQESDNIENWWPENLNYGALSKVRVYATRDRRVFVAVPTGSSAVNNRLVEIVTWLRLYIPRSRGQGYSGFGPPACMFHDLPVESMCTFRPVNTDLIYAGASDTNKIHRLFDGLTDAGVAISAYWKSGWQKFISEEPFERIRRINVEMSGRCYVDVFRDFYDTPVFLHAALTQTVVDPYWEGGPWEGGVWDTVIRAALNRIRPETRGRYHAIQFRNADLNTTFTVYAAEFAIRGGKET
jgi:hypothetical protein